jgi:acetyl-CoA C-acetyltransferase/acetyl-CoA acyltransferase
MGNASVAGVGMTEFGVHEERLEELFSEAAIKAIDDAGVDFDEIDSFYLGNAVGGMIENDTHLAPKLASHLGIAGIPCQRFEDACATSSNALKHAVRAVESGVHDVVLVGGAERCTQGTGKSTAEMTRIFSSASDKRFEQPAGLTFPGVFAILTKRYMHEYGTSREDLAAIAVKNHHHGTMNERAQFGEEKTVAEVLESPPIADPFTLYDCSPFSDGAAAVVVTSADRAESFDGDPVTVAGIGHRTDVVPLADKNSLTATQSARDARKDAYSEAGIEPTDVDFAEVHDCFTGAEILAIEALGLYETGAGGQAAVQEETYIGGEMPINPSGGLKAKGHPIGATGAAQIVELTEQLRGDAGERQVADASIAVAHNLGGDAATTVVSVLEAGA